MLGFTKRKPDSAAKQGRRNRKFRMARSFSMALLNASVPCALPAIAVFIAVHASGLGVADAVSSSAETDVALSTKGRVLEDYGFDLPNGYGKHVQLDDYRSAKAVVVAFLGVECPLAKLYARKLEVLQQDFSDRGVAVVAIDSNLQDSLTEIRAFTRRQGVSFEILRDTRCEAANRFGATRTPEVFLLDDGRQLRYAGRIDDQYGVGYTKKQASNQFLRDAIEAVLDGRRVANDRVKAVGCLIGRPKKAERDAEVTYSNQVARILATHCVECHRADEIGPFSLTDYEEVVGWADMIDEVVQDGRMPPWHADPAFGPYAGERLMSEDEKRLISRWVASGAPLGDDNLPQPVSGRPAGWRLPKRPDLVVPMHSKPFRVPAEGVIEYQYFAVDPGLTEDAWVQAAELVPGARSVVHHAIVFVSPPVGRDKRGLGWLTAYVPGQDAMVLPTHQARRIPAGSKLIFQMHYTPTGIVEEDLTRLALVFADPQLIREEVVTLYAANGRFEIPPHASDYRVEARLRSFPPQSRLLGMSPHMHVRGRSFRVSARWPSGDQRVLLSVPRYDFNWQHVYRLPEPIALEPGLALECEARFDNSRGNVVNPDPSARVRWGDQTFDEMMIAFFDVAVPKGAPTRVAKRKGPSRAALDDAERTSNRLIKRFDANGDAVLDRDELPHAFRVFALDRYDGNGDGRISSEEAFSAALKRATDDT